MLPILRPHLGMITVVLSTGLRCLLLCLSSCSVFAVERELQLDTIVDLVIRLKDDVVVQPRILNVVSYPLLL